MPRRRRTEEEDAVPIRRTPQQWHEKMAKKGATAYREWKERLEAKKKAIKDAAIERMWEYLPTAIAEAEKPREQQNATIFDKAYDHARGSGQIQTEFCYALGMNCTALRALQRYRRGEWDAEREGSRGFYLPYQKPPKPKKERPRAQPRPKQEPRADYLARVLKPKRRDRKAEEEAAVLELLRANPSVTRRQIASRLWELNEAIAARELAADKENARGRSVAGRKAARKRMVSLKTAGRLRDKVRKKL